MKNKPNQPKANPVAPAKTTNAAASSASTSEPSKRLLALPAKKLDRFWGQVSKTDRCWNWTGHKNGPEPGREHGIIRVNGKEVRVHRLSYMIHIGPIPDGYFVCHRCDNALCVNPAHLFVGTHNDNMADMVQKRRSTWGSRNPNAKLNDNIASKMKEMLSRGIKQGTIAAEFGVSPSLISHLSRGKIWRHV